MSDDDEAWPELAPVQHGDKWYRLDTRPGRGPTNSKRCRRATRRSADDHAPAPALHPTHHAVEALARFYPRADGRQVMDEVERGVPVEPGTAVALVGRARFRFDSSYVLHRERTGMFVLVGQRVVTFLRFYARKQHDLAVQLWPGGDAVSTTEPLWTRPDATPEPTPKTGAPVVRVSDAARAATGRTKRDLQEIVRAAVEADALESADGWMSVRQLDGVLTVDGVTIGVAVEGFSIRVFHVGPGPERAAAAKAERAAARRERRAAERAAAGLQQAAALLRAKGWTCIPPTEETT